MRTLRNRIRLEGVRCSFELLSRPVPDGTLAELREVSDEWLATPNISAPLPDRRRPPRHYCRRFRYDMGWHRRTVHRVDAASRRRSSRLHGLPSCECDPMGAIGRIPI